MIGICCQWKTHSHDFFSPSVAAIEETGFCFVLSLLLWPNSALKRFMAVTYTHSYSFVSIETLSRLQACIWELHKPLTVIRNTHRGGYFHLTGSLFLGLVFNNCRKITEAGDLLLFLSRSAAFCYHPDGVRSFTPCVNFHRGLSCVVALVKVEARSRTVPSRCLLAPCAIWMWALQNSWSLATRFYIRDATLPLITDGSDRHKCLSNAWKLHVYW